MAKNTLQSYQGNRCIGVAKVTFGSGGVPSCSAGDNGIPGFNIARSAAGVYSMAFFPQRNIAVQYSTQRVTGASGFLMVRGDIFAPLGTSGAQNTGFGSFRTVGSNGAALSPADSDQISVWFFATDSDAS